jgi:hypothetical protein
MLKKIFLLLSIFVLAIGCSSQRKKQAQQFEQLLESGTGQQWSIAKLETKTGKYTVYYNETTGEYVAYNMDTFDKDNMTTLAQYNAAARPNDIIGNLFRQQEWVESGYWQSVYETYYYTDYEWSEACDCWYPYTYSESVYVGQVWVDTSSWVTFFYGGGFKFDNAGGVKRDLELLGSLNEEAGEKMVAAKLKTEFSLSIPRAQELAKLAVRYQKLENARALTEAEKNTFALSALGVSMKDIEVALKEKAEGSEDRYKELLNDAADFNKTSPEKIGQIMDQVLEAI